MTVAVLLFDEFETLDVFGPVEIFGRLKDNYQIEFYAHGGGIVKNSHGVALDADKLEAIKDGVDIFIISGGYGTRILVEDTPFINLLKQVAAASKFVLSVCTGSGLLAKTGLIDGREATSNKRALNWAMSQGTKVNWIKKARWTNDGKFYTSSGVSAGMDMTLGFIADTQNLQLALRVADEIEYTWQQDKHHDSFYKD